MKMLPAIRTVHATRLRAENSQTSQCARPPAMNPHVRIAVLSREYGGIGTLVEVGSVRSSRIIAPF